jgi:L-asparaginase
MLATGGTISTSENKEKGGLINTYSGEELINDIEATMDVEVVNFSKISSVYLTPLNMFELAKAAQDYLNQEDVVGVVITHGTSTMEETSFMLDLLIDSHKPVVITGSQKSSTDSWPDGPSNLKNAIRVAADESSIGKGVIIVFADSIYEGKDAKKIHTTALNAFDSGEKGILGYIYSDKVIYNRARQRKTLKIDDFNSPYVEVIKFYAGAGNTFFEAAMSQGVKGIVVEGVGLGNVNKDFYNGIKQAREREIEVVITTRCQNGRVLPKYAYEGGGVSLERLGVIFGGALSSPKARLLLMLLLNNQVPHTQMQESFNLYSN